MRLTCAKYTLKWLMLFTGFAAVFPGPASATLFTWDITGGGFGLRLENRQDADSAVDLSFQGQAANHGTLSFDDVSGLLQIVIEDVQANIKNAAGSVIGQLEISNYTMSYSGELAVSIGDGGVPARIIARPGSVAAGELLGAGAIRQNPIALDVDLMGAFMDPDGAFPAGTFAGALFGGQFHGWVKALPFSFREGGAVYTAAGDIHLHLAPPDAAIPEPASLLLLGAGLLGGAARRAFRVQPR